MPIHPCRPMTRSAVLLASANAALRSDGAIAYSVFQQGAGLVDAVGAVTDRSSGCANRNMNVIYDLLGIRHYVGPAGVGRRRYLLPRRQPRNAGFRRGVRVDTGVRLGRGARFGEKARSGVRARYGVRARSGARVPCGVKAQFGGKVRCGEKVLCGEKGSAATVTRIPLMNRGVIWPAGALKEEGRETDPYRHTYGWTKNERTSLWLARSRCA